MFYEAEDVVLLVSLFRETTKIAYEIKFAKYTKQATFNLSPPHTELQKDDERVIHPAYEQNKS